MVSVTALTFVFLILLLQNSRHFITGDKEAGGVRLPWQATRVWAISLPSQATRGWGFRFHSVPLGLAAVWGMLSKSQQPPLNVDAGDSRMHVSAPWSVAVDVGGNKGTRLRLNDKRGWRC